MKTLNEIAAAAMEIARKRVRDRKLLGHPAHVLSLADLVAHAWLCGAIDALTAQKAAEEKE